METIGNNKVLVAGVHRFSVFGDGCFVDALGVCGRQGELSLVVVAYRRLTFTCILLGMFSCRSMNDGSCFIMAVLQTLVNQNKDGCNVSLPLIYVVMLATVAVTYHFSPMLLRRRT